MLNQQQQEAVCHVFGPCLCLAGPGSGKTTVLTRRIKNLIFAEHIAPENILVITFTKAAAKEMKTRFDALTGGNLPVVFGTFHSVFYGILRKERAIGGACLMNPTQKRRLLSEAAASCGVPLEGRDETELLAREISVIKNTMADPNTYQSGSFPGEVMDSVCRAYEAKKETGGYLDFDDLLSKTLALFLSRPDILRRWQLRFVHILIDEIQDMNLLQFQIIQRLALPWNNLFAVGDDDQSIYGFRGASPAIMLGFENIYPQCRKILLSENYRSGSSIVSAAGCLIRQNQNRFPKEQQAKSKNPGRIFYMEAEDEKAEASMAAALIKKAKAQVPFTEMAVLFRNRSQGILMAGYCQKEGIPFLSAEPVSNPYEHWIMQDMIAYLRLAAGEGMRRDILRIMNRPERGLSRAGIETEQFSFEKWCEYYRGEPAICRKIKELQQDLLFLKKLSKKAAVSFILKKIGYEGYLLQRAADEREWEEWKQVLADFEELAGQAKNGRQIITFWEERRMFLEKTGEQRKASGDGVRLLTLHGAKGLEFSHVFLLGCNEELLPSKKAVTAEQLEEERRIFYVGITRAKEQLYLFYHRKAGDEKSSPSRFLKEMQQAAEESQSFVESVAASSKSSSNRSSTALYSSSDCILSREGVPFSSSK